MAARHSSRSGVFLALALGAGGGCTAYSTQKNLPLDCNVTNAYQLRIVDKLNELTLPPQAPTQPFWTTADHSVDAGGTGSMYDAIAPITDGSLCGTTAALEFTGAHNDDWGSLSGYSTWGTLDASAYEGLAFWARSPGNTSKSFTMLFGDPNTYSAGAVDAPPMAPYNCKNYPSADGGVSSSGPIVDPGTGQVLSSGSLTAPSPPDACNNYYQAVLTVTNDWQFYTIPFAQFQQTAEPNRVPNADLATVGTAPGTSLITSALMLFELRFPREAVIDLWMSNLAFYRKAPVTDAGTDGAIDAPHP